MLSIGWPEMMLVAAAALIIVGPRDLPMLLKNIGNIVGKVRRMGNDFKAEINKATAFDEIKDIKSSITQPLTDTRREIEQDFNKITDFGVEPTGAIKSKNPDATDVYDEIKAASAKTAETASAAAKASMAAAVTTATTAKAAKAKEKKELQALQDVQNLTENDPAPPARKARASKKKPAAKKAPARKPAAKRTKKND